jgi:lipoyl(octanoyl) transferase
VIDGRHTSCRESAEPVDVRLLGTVDYAATWDLQRELATARADGGRDTLLLLEHHSVFTAGRRTQPEDRPTDGSPVIDVDRGGKITWHGPGQLVGYPIVRLANPIDVVNYVRRLEEALIAVCDSFGVTDAGRVAGRSGVWLPAGDGRIERKIAAIGIRVQREVTMHGFEINCDADLGSFDKIIPCGIRDVGTTSLSAEVGRPVPVAEVLPVARDAILAALDGKLPVTDRPIRRVQPQVPGVEFQLAP